MLFSASIFGGNSRLVSGLPRRLPRLAGCLAHKSLANGCAGARRLPRLAGCLALLGWWAAAGPALAYETTTRGAANIHAEPRNGAEVVDVLRPGEAVEVLRCRLFWCQISHSGPDGWVKRRVLSSTDGGGGGGGQEIRGEGGGGGGGGGVGNAGGIGTAASGRMIWTLLTSLFSG